jgi:assimilatory nitrate reductase catalytic subunit
MGVNALTTPAYCPRSKQPELKNAAVKVAKAALPWRLLALAWLPADRALAVREALRPLLREFGFATLVPFGRERSGVLLRAAALEAPPPALLLQIEAQLGLAVDGALHYADARRGQRRTVRLAGAGAALRLDGFLFGGDISAEAWVRPLLQDELPAQAYGRTLLVPGATPPVALVPRARQVCNCFDVDAARIGAVLARATGTPEARLDQLQRGLKCGTRCGSCLPELRRMVRAHAAPASAVQEATT